MPARYHVMIDLGWVTASRCFGAYGDYSHVRSHDGSGDQGGLIGDPPPNTYLRRMFKTFF